MNIFDKLTDGCLSKSPEQTARIANKLAVTLPNNALLALQGDLGAGKTTFVKALAKAWGIEQTVKSPTFNLVSMYEGSRQLVHVDAYRLQSPEAIEGLMLDEFLKEPYCLVIEWPERIHDWIPSDSYWLRIQIISPEERLLKLVSSKDR